jgi:hypothetical protein
VVFIDVGLSVGSKNKKDPPSKGESFNINDLIHLN